MGALQFQKPLSGRVKTGVAIVALLSLVIVWLTFGLHGRNSLFLAGLVGQIALTGYMAHACLPWPWLWRWLAFITLVNLEQPVSGVYGWAGCFTLLAVAFAEQYLQSVYRGTIQAYWLVACGVVCATTGWLVPEAGWSITLGIGVFSLLHCFLHEREEKGVSYHQVSNRQVALRWLKCWGIAWVLPLLAVELGGWLAGNALFSAHPLVYSGAINADLDTAASGIGYFSSFHSEFTAAFQPLMAGKGQLSMERWVACAAQVVRLLSVGLLPLAGILATGYTLPNRFIYRLLRREDEALLLYWLCGGMLILGMLGHSTSETMVALGGLSLLLGWLALSRWAERRPRMEPVLRWAITLLLGLMLADRLLTLGVR